MKTFGHSIDKMQFIDSFLGTPVRGIIPCSSEGIDYCTKRWGKQIQALCNGRRLQLVNDPGSYCPCTGRVKAFGGNLVDTLIWGDTIVWKGGIDAKKSLY